MSNKARETEVEDEESDFKPLTAEQAQEWRARHPQPNVWWMVVLQVLAGLLVTALAAGLSGQSHVAWSAAYGALAVVVPSALFVRGLRRQSQAPSTGSAMLGLMVWELIKIALTIAMLVAAPKVLPQLSWLALLAGMVVTMKTYWIVLLVRPRVRKTI